MNMPSATDNLVHQIIGDVEHVKSIDEMYDLMQHNDFIIIRQFYSRRDVSGDKYLEDRGEMILNSEHIGKIQEYFEG
jgi:hypothetical protein